MKREAFSTILIIAPISVAAVDAVTYHSSRRMYGSDSTDIPVLRHTTQANKALDHCCVRVTVNARDSKEEKDIVMMLVQYEVQNLVPRAMTNPGKI